jgi:hypothetical protein
MRSLRLMAFVVLLPSFAVPVARAGTPVHLWSQRYGGIDYDIGNKIVVDGSGDILVAGEFGGTLNLGGGNLISAGNNDVFLAKYTAAGAHIWSQRFGGASYDYAGALAVDASGNILLTGSFQQSTNYGGADLTSAGGSDIYLARYTSSGTHLWSERFGGPDYETPYGVAADGAGNVVLAGSFTDSTDFGGGLLVGDYTEAFVAKFDPSGAHLWSRSFGASFSDVASGVALDGSDNVVLAGYFNYTVDFGGGGLVSAGNADVFLAKYTPAGAHMWSQRFGGLSTDNAYDVAVDGSDNILLTGTFMGTADFGGGGMVSAGYQDVFVAAYDASGAHRWSRRAGGVSTDNPHGIDVDAAGNILLTGYFQGVTSLGGATFVSAGDTDGFIARYDATGAHEWSMRFGGTWRDRGFDVAADTDGNVFSTGFFYGAANLGGDDFVSAGGYDVFIAEYASTTAEPLISSIADIGNDQGRQVKLRFLRSGYDTEGSFVPIASYEAYRRDDPPPAGASVTDRELRAQGWTFVGSAPAHRESSYGIDVPTVGDSTEALGPYHSVFYVRATTTDLTKYFDSPADSGYSIDNLAPGAPTDLFYDDGVLTWGACSDPDFDRFVVYGAPGRCFCGAVVVGECTAPAMDVGGSPYAFYFVTAADRSGNESGSTIVYAGAKGTPAHYVLSVANHPNPFNPATEVAFTIPASGPVTLAIYDVRGARIATLVDHVEHAAGAYRAPWNGMSDLGVAAPSGIYFARIDHNGTVRTRKLVMLK